MKVPFIIVLAHQKGGVGKSTIASNLVVELSKDYKLSVLDLDMQKSLTYFNSLRKRNGLDEFKILTADGISEVKNIINNNKDILLIDVGGFDSDVNRIAILGADLVITPVSDSGIELVGLLSFRNILREIRKHRPSLKSHVLLNRVNVRAGVSLEEIFDFIDNNNEFDKFNVILRDRADYKKSFDAGKSVIEYNGKASEEMKDLIKEVINAQNS